MSLLQVTAVSYAALQEIAVNWPRLGVDWYGDHIGPSAQPPMHMHIAHYAQWRLAKTKPNCSTASSDMSAHHVSDNHLKVGHSMLYSLDFHIG